MCVCRQCAVGFSSTDNSIWLLGGADHNDAQLISFDPEGDIDGGSKFTYHQSSILGDATIRGYGTYYTQYAYGPTLFILDGYTGSGNISRFDMNTVSMDWSFSLTAPLVVGNDRRALTGACLVSVSRALFVVGGHLQKWNASTSGWDSEAYLNTTQVYEPDGIGDWLSRCVKQKHSD